MKAIITAVLILGLTAVSCKKEVQTSAPSANDTIPAIDSTNMNMSPMPEDTMTTTSQSSGDSMNTKMKDSVGTTPR